MRRRRRRPPASERAAALAAAPARAPADGRRRRSPARGVSASCTASSSSWGTQERILVCMTPRANAATMLASGRRNADRFHGELFAVYVNQPNLTAGGSHARSPATSSLARAQEAHVEIARGKDPIEAILDYARAQGITQTVRRPQPAPDVAQRASRGTPLDRLIRRGRGHGRPRLPALTRERRTCSRAAAVSRSFSATPPASARPTRC